MSPRAKLDPKSVDTVEDLGQLLAENADLDRLVQKVREAQKHQNSAAAQQRRRSLSGEHEGPGRRSRRRRGGRWPVRRHSPMARPPRGPRGAGRSCTARSAAGAPRKLAAASAARARPLPRRAFPRPSSDRRSLWRATLHPTARRKLTWDALQLLALCYCVLCLPLVLGFEAVMPAASADALRALNGAVDLFVLLDVGVMLRTAFVVEGVLVRDLKTIATHYARGALARDLLGALPLSLVRAFDFAAVPGWLPLLFGVIRLLRFRRLAASAAELLSVGQQTVGMNPGIIRLGRLGSLFLLSCHWVGCCWYAIALHGGDADAKDSDSWGPPPWLLERPWGEQYGFSFYWAVGLLTAIAPADIHPDTPLETAFTLLAMLLGVAILALVVSSATSAVHSVDAAAEAQRRELDIINGYLRFKRVPKDLVNRINDFYGYLFGSMRSLDNSSAIQSLPPQLNIQLLVAINMRTLSKVPIFKDCDIRAMISVIERMQPAIYCPNEIIVREGTPGKAIFLINQGHVRVLKGEQQVAILVDHQFFGEQSILTESLTNASVRAVTYCDMSILLRDQFQQVKQHFPELKQGIERAAAERAQPTPEAGKQGLGAIQQAAKLAGHLRRSGSLGSLRSGSDALPSEAGSPLAPTAAHDESLAPTGDVATPSPTRLSDRRNSV
eukprot:Transcript_10847.p1 GENE.Transcript_10847~~Transcript_10847.p1  ORF type:complete len:668 (-),score=257.90 Transcript_10847:1154-3157(-)